MRWWRRSEKIEAVIADHAAELVVIDSIRTVLFYVRAKDAPTEKDYTDFIAHLKRRGYHLILIG